MKLRTGIAVCIALTVLLLAACGSNTVTNTSQSGGTNSTTVSSHEVQVTINGSHITSSLTTFMPNIPYNFVVTNNGHNSHEFIIRTRTQGPSANQPNNQGVLYKLSSPLGAGSTTKFTYDFPIATPQSSVEFTTQLTSSSTQGGNNGNILPVQVNQG